MTDQPITTATSRLVEMQVCIQSNWSTMLIYIPLNTTESEIEKIAICACTNKLKEQYGRKFKQSVSYVGLYNIPSID